MSDRQVTERLWVELIPAVEDPEDDPVQAYVAVTDRVTGDTAVFGIAAIPRLITALRQTYNEAMGLPESSVRE